MFNDIVKILASIRGVSVTQIGKALHYKTNSSFQTVITGRDIRLTVLCSIAKYCNCDIVLTNNKGINISLTKYIEEHNTNNATVDDNNANN